MTALPEHEIDPRRPSPADLEGKHSLQIQTTTACNARCVFCPHHETWGASVVRRMSQDTFERVVDQARSFRFHKVAPYLQSEPLADGRIFGFIEALASQLRFDLIEVSTNPGAISRERVDSLAMALAGVPSEVRLSFHGVDEDSLRRNMGLDFERSLRDSVYLLRVAEDAGLSVTIKALGRERAPARAESSAFNEAAMERFWTEVCEREDLSLDRLTLKYGRHHNRSDNVDRADAAPDVVRPDLSGFYCTRVDRWFHVTYDGVLILCCNDYRREVQLGDVRESDLREIVSSDAYRDVVAQVKGESPSPAHFLCKRCTSPGG